MGINARMQSSDIPFVKADVNGVEWSHTRGGLIYYLETPVVSGLLLYIVGSCSEIRMFRREYTGIRELDCHPETGRIVCAVYGSQGESNIAIVNDNCTGTEQVTEGDSIDGMPRWIPGSNASVVYHSAGIARTREGVYSGTALMFSSSGLRLTV